jgi:ribosomal-protein-alanine N-acetyltransferase
MRANTELGGLRVRLRDFRADDAADVFAYASDPLVTECAGWRPHRTLHDSWLYIQRCVAQTWPPITFAVEHVPERRVIGVVDIRTVSRLWAVGEIGYTLAQPYWGRGFNLEAGRLLIDYGFERLGFRRIRAVCDIDNRRSYRTMEKLGMMRESLIADACTRNGRLIDRVVYSVLRREWDRRRPSLPTAAPPADRAAALSRCDSRGAADRRSSSGSAAGTPALLGP